ncbi:HsdM family class I SAM-dependent methyltransferase [Streptomyces aidingensis]|uniref:N-6 DNA Methylase n=1 Tax=Streptomyces aidingensis TaxID=910347 RepID=A0A1I1GZJ6_9ACTN|nr:N-6 DNA methylase [Streptomyces aidingensis]SFC14370.1 N-6 DNA Methylase [Streptomyces aidingensis]
MPEQDAEVTSAGIARLAGVGRAAVSNWRRRHEDFPRPVGGTQTSPTFALPEIERWLRRNGKLAEVPLRERLWQLVEAREGTAGTGAGTGTGTLAATLARIGEQLLDHGSRTPEEAGPIAATAAALAAETSPADAFGFLLDRYLDTVSRQLSPTPPEAAALMAALAGPAATVLDPACGPATLLAAARGDGRDRPAELLGQDTDASLARLGGLRLALRGGSAVQIHPGDALRADVFPDRTVDAVLCHPPFNERHWGHDQLTYDPRWEYGLPARTESELAWVQHALARLRPGGTAVLLMPPAAASRRTGRRIRAALLRRGALRAVIALPAGAAPPHNLALHLWVLTRPGGPPGPGPRLLVVDAAGPHHREHRSDGRRPVDWPAVQRTVLDAWAAFAGSGTGAGLGIGIPGVRRAIPAIDLLDEDVDLAPARHLPPPAEASGPDALGRVRGLLRDGLLRSHELTPELPAAGPAPAAGRPTVTLAELARGGALTVHTVSGEETLPEPRPGDVLVPLLGDSTAFARVVTEETAGRPALAPGDRHTGLLRPDPAALDPWFLAGFLRNTRNTRQASSYASAASRIDLRRLKVPRLPLAAQHAYGRCFRDLAAFEAELERTLSLGRRYVQGAVDGLTDGTLPAPRPD